MSITLDQVALVGRTYNEYKRMFDVTKESLEGKKVLDVAAGVSSFCAIGNAVGLNITAIDPAYYFMADEIETKAEEDLDTVLAKLAFNKSHYNWDFYHDIEGVRISRFKAYQTFLKDYQSNPSNYIPGEVSKLPFEDKEFDTTLVSHLMFLYDHLFTEEEQIATFRELIRVTRNEIIIFPTKNLSGQNSKWVDLIIKNTEFLEHTFRLEKAQFEFQKGNSLRLRVTV
ncbi:MAG: ubiquinone/menaquinone biosynthesis C-methylase UbiE [Flavobacteriales bacterium]|jgi:ubiquinone/menaquinone biosynthesis C-methylase UbiE|tara:strand:- start:3224 stop:3904 length:681 start_codon:yes stop_codon:yes gene_type:complete